MMDVSDGLSSELIHICTQSGVGCHVFEDRIPIDYQTAATAEEFNMNLTTAAMNGGEDYELLFTVPLELHDLIEGVEDVHVIGHVCDKSLGMNLVTRDGQEFGLKAQGWNAFQ
jgi:thiamine-monophosphate kinase